MSTSVKRAHQPIPGMSPLFHTYCSDHPEFGTCEEEARAHRDIADHLDAEHAAVKQEGACTHDDVDYKPDYWACRTCGHREITPHATQEGARG